MRAFATTPLLSTILIWNLACAQTAEVELRKPIELSAAQQAVVRNGVTERLKDPEAKFGQMFAIEHLLSNGESLIDVCGYVSTKNFERTVFNGMYAVGGKGPVFIILFVGDSDETRRQAVQGCRKGGFPVD